MKDTGQESGGELCQIFKFWSFLQSKSVNDVCKLLQLLGDRPPTGASPLYPCSGGPQYPKPPWAIAPTENSWRLHEPPLFVSYVNGRPNSCRPLCEWHSGRIITRKKERTKLVKREWNNHYTFGVPLQPWTPYQAAQTSVSLVCTPSVDSLKTPKRLKKAQFYSLCKCCCCLFRTLRCGHGPGLYTLGVGQGPWCVLQHLYSPYTASVRQICLNCTEGQIYRQLRIATCTAIYLPCIITASIGRSLVAVHSVIACLRCRWSVWQRCQCGLRIIQSPPTTAAGVVYQHGVRADYPAPVVAGHHDVWRK